MESLCSSDSNWWLTYRNLNAYINVSPGDIKSSFFIKIEKFLVTWLLPYEKWKMRFSILSVEKSILHNQFSCSTFKEHFKNFTSGMWKIRFKNKTMLWPWGWATLEWPFTLWWSTQPHYRTNTTQGVLFKVFNEFFCTYNMKPHINGSFSIVLKIRSA